MSINRFKKIIGQAVVATGLLLGSAMAGAVTTISLLPADQAVPFVPGTFSVNIFATDLPDSTTGGTLNIDWLAADMTLNSVVADPAWDNFFYMPGTINNAAGTLTDLTVGDFFGVTGNSAIATLNFSLDHAAVVDSVINMGQGTDVWSGVDPGNVPFDLIPGDTILFAGTTINPSVAVIPVPAAVWLFGSGLLGLVGVARRRG